MKISKEKILRKKGKRKGKKENREQIKAYKAIG